MPHRRSGSQPDLTPCLAFRLLAPYPAALPLSAPCVSRLPRLLARLLAPVRSAYLTGCSVRSGNGPLPTACPLRLVRRACLPPLPLARPRLLPVPLLCHRGADLPTVRVPTGHPCPYPVPCWLRATGSPIAPSSLLVRAYCCCWCWCWWYPSLPLCYPHYTIPRGPAQPRLVEVGFFPRHLPPTYLEEGCATSTVG